MGAGLAVPAFVGTGVSAEAATCASGRMCIWEHNDFAGAVLAHRAQQGNLNGSAMNQNGSLAAANAIQCAHTRFFDAATRTGSYFTPYTERIFGSNYRDPYLANGAGTGPHVLQNWDDRLSALNFIKC